MTEFFWSAAQSRLFRANAAFEPLSLTWRQEARMPQDAQPIAPRPALLQLAATTPLKRVPIGIIGPREASASQYDLAEEVGAAFARHGLQLLCGGRSGVMEAACKGHSQAGGLPIGLLPDDEWHEANPFVAIPIATGIGPARNAIIARACLALVAVGGGVGTISEMALGLQFGRLVLAMADAPEVAGIERVDGVETALDRIALRLLM